MLRQQFFYTITSPNVHMFNQIKYNLNHILALHCYSPLSSLTSKSPIIVSHFHHNNSTSTAALITRNSKILSSPLSCSSASELMDPLLVLHLDNTQVMLAGKRTFALKSINESPAAYSDGCSLPFALYYQCNTVKVDNG